MAGLPTDSSQGKTRLIEVRGLKEFRKNLKAMGSELPKELRTINKHVADEARDMARAEANRMGSVFAKASGSIRSYATQNQASIGFNQGGIANVAFWGTKRRSGWYNWRRYLSNSQEGVASREGWVAGSHGIKQHPPWIGSDWDVGVEGQGPYAINDAIARGREYLDDIYLDEIGTLAHTTGAFPDS